MTVSWAVLRRLAPFGAAAAMVALMRMVTVESAATESPKASMRPVPLAPTGAGRSVTPATAAASEAPVRLAGRSSVMSISPATEPSFRTLITYCTASPGNAKPPLRSVMVLKVEVLSKLTAAESEKLVASMAAAVVGSSVSFGDDRKGAVIWPWFEMRRPSMAADVTPAAMRSATVLMRTVKESVTRSEPMGLLMPEIFTSPVPFVPPASRLSSVKPPALTVSRLAKGVMSSWKTSPVTDWVASLRMETV